MPCDPRSARKDLPPVVMGLADWDPKGRPLSTHRVSKVTDSHIAEHLKG